jgi:HlyD family secretion protein
MLQKQQAALIAGKPNVEKQVAALRGQIATAETELKRLKRMQAGGAATGKQVDDVEAQLSVLRSQLDATLQSLNASVSSLNNNVSAMELQIRQLDYSISKATISSPISGTVMVKYLNAGEMAAAGRPLMKVADLDHMYLRAYFTSEQLSDISLGDEVTVIADFGGDKQIKYPGTITWIAQESEFTPKGIQTRGDRANLVYAVKIAVKNDGRLKIGLFGEVRLNSKKDDRH